MGKVLLLGSNITAVMSLILFSCGQHQTVAQTSKMNQNDQTLTIVEPYKGNMEWVAYREHTGMMALHLKPSPNIYAKEYELKCEWYMNGEKKAEEIYKSSKLGSIKSAFYEDSLLHYYAFLKPDTAYMFNFSPQLGYSYSTYVPLDPTMKNIFRWVTLSQNSKSYQLKDSTWVPIIALTQPFMESCTPEKCYYCVLPENASHYQDWGKTMGIKQYFIVSIRLL